MRTYAGLCVAYADLCGRPMRTYAYLCAPMRTYAPKAPKKRGLVDVMRPELRPVRLVLEPSQFSCFPVNMSSDEVASFQKLRAATKFVLEHLLALDLLARTACSTRARTRFMRSLNATSSSVS